MLAVMTVMLSCPQGVGRIKLLSTDVEFETGDSDEYAQLIVISAGIQQVNEALATLRFLPDPDFLGSARIVVTASDNG